MDFFFSTFYCIKIFIFRQENVYMVKSKKKKNPDGTRICSEKEVFLTLGSTISHFEPKLLSCACF